MQQLLVVVVLDLGLVQQLELVVVQVEAAVLQTLAVLAHLDKDLLVVVEIALAEDLVVEVAAEQVRLAWEMELDLMAV
jgi:hypothetical protein